MMAARWFALAVHARQEKGAAAELAAHGVEVFLPLKVERRAWSDRVQNVELALFPGYLFVRVTMSAARRVELLQVHQVIDLVGRLPGDERIARSIPDQDISSLQTVVASPYNLDPVERLVPGKTILVAAGPLKGVRGIVVHEPNGKRRLVVQIELLGRGVATELAAADLVEAPAEP
ncbi:MAG: UpxY family transcription antiterminator [Deltaproteobacteria bacterium]|nr:UpxY family transcription antiterminator [Deltaproteobacteria bacterium]